MLGTNRFVSLMAFGALATFLCGAAWAEKAPLSTKELEETATHIVVGRVQAIYSRTERKGNYEYTRFIAEVRIEKVEKGEAPSDLIYVRYFDIDWKGPGNPPPGPSGHTQPKLGSTHRFYLARNAYDGFSTKDNNNDGGYNVVYGNGIQPAKP